MAEQRSRLASTVDEVIRGKYLPWLVATLVVSALSVRIGILQTVPMVVSSCVLLALVLCAVQWCAARDDPTQLKKPSLVGCETEVVRRYSIGFGRSTETL